LVSAALSTAPPTMQRNIRTAATSCASCKNARSADRKTRSVISQSTAPTAPPMRAGSVASVSIRRPGRARRLCVLIA